MSQQVWHAKEPSLINGIKRRTGVKFYSPSPQNSCRLHMGEKQHTNKVVVFTFMFKVEYSLPSV